MSWLDNLLARARQEGVSDVHLKAGMPVVFRRPGGLERVGQQELTDEQLLGLVHGLLGQDLFAQFEANGEADTAYQSDVGGRVRVNCYRERGITGIALRTIPEQPPTIEQLGLPSQLTKLSEFPDGLVIVAGPTGSGKSTTMASVINEINRTRALHIVSIEDPIEYVHRNQMSVITQREVGTDTRSFQEALRRVLRQDPDAIIIGEARDAETMRTALTAAETGHLVFTTLHTVTARETINRVLEMFPHEEQNQVRHTLAGILRAVICQRMAPRADTDGKTVVQEILFSSGRIEDAIIDPEKGTMIDEIIAEGKDGYGMQTFNQAFCDLVSAGKLSVETAMRMTNNPQNLRQMLHRVTGTDPLADPEAPAGSRIQLD